MSTAGLRKVGNYEEVLAQALKDEQHVNGVINPYLANAATRIINNPEFQRVKDRLEDDLTQQTKNHINEQNFEHHVTNLAVDARINRSDLDYIIGNLQQPPPPPAPPPPPTDGAADRARLIAELDGLAQERDRKMRDEMMAQHNAANLAAQRVETPAQQIVNHYHTPAQPIYIPTPQVPPQENHSELMRQFGMTMQQLFLARQQEPVYRRPPGEIPITYTAGDPPPPPAPGAGAIVRPYGPAKLAKSRYAPFQSAQQPPPPGGATSPMPVEQRRRRREVPIRREYFPVRPTPAPPPPPSPPPDGGGGVEPVPIIAAIPRTIKRKVEPPVGISGKGPRVPRFAGTGHRLPEGDGFRGPSATLGQLGAIGKHSPPTIISRPGYEPFSGRAQRLPDEHGLRANAIQRMRELGHQGMQKRRASEMLDRKDDMGRALRRGGARGDVVGLGKRKRDAEEFAPNPRQRKGDRPVGPQRFSISA